VAFAPSDREATLAPGFFALVHRRGSHVWTIVVMPASAARSVAAVDGTRRLEELRSAVGFLLALQEAGLVEWSRGAPAGGPQSPFDAAAVPGAGDDAPAVSGIAPCFWGE
jgi:hypothetical protein